MGATTKASVFSRLGGADDATGATDGEAGGKWGHDGFASLYGRAAKKSNVIKKPLASAISKAKPVPKGDLRGKLKGGPVKPRGPLNAHGSTSASSRRRLFGRHRRSPACQTPGTDELRPQLPL